MLLGVADRVRDTIGVRLHSMARREYEHDAAAARAALGDQAFAAAWEQGRALALEQVVAEVLKAETSL
jgi:hypothetical protein